MIVVKIFGGLGNQMFQYAAARALAHKNNTEVKLDINHYKIKILPYGLPYRTFDLSIFNFNQQIASDEEIGKFKSSDSGFLNRNIKKVTNLIHPHQLIHEPHFHFYEEVLNEKGNIYLDGYWQTEKYFLEIEHIIREEFTIKHSLTAEGMEMLNKIKNTNSVCLNIRRLEFATNPHLNQFVGLDYFEKAMEYMNSKITNPHFFVFSDELDWVKQHLKITSPYTIVESNLYGEKFKECLYLMTQCRHFIIPNSTFGWWAAWLSSNKDKIVVAPQNWLSDSKFNTKDIIPDRWIKI